MLEIKYGYGKILVVIQRIEINYDKKRIVK